MQSITDILNILLKSIFVGFGFIIPILTLLRISDIKTLQIKDLFILTAVQTVRISGIIYFILAAVAVYPLLMHDNSMAGNVKVDFGGFAMYILFSPIMTLVITQLFWIKRLYMKKGSRITLSFMLLLLPSAVFLAIAKSQDFMPALKATLSGPEILKTLISCIIFIFITFTIILMGGKLKDKKA
ncbi:hypothetical protein [Flavobacterium suzhouense]|uniref:Uncharacterized protein n=1 Tax=Flavobacterium suzhouense TaxID=1529638 RepID=A0ABW5NWT1_9FLAO